MEIEIYKLLIQYGGGATIIVAIVFLLKELNLLLKIKNNHKENGCCGVLEKRIQALEKLTNNDMHEIKGDINNLQKEVDQLNERMTRVETVLKIKKIML